nr:MAG TPA: hypothetical protein [Caudoviricetes sp.]
MPTLCCPPLHKICTRTNAQAPPVVAIHFSIFSLLPL